jgi:hypothetical protein
MRRAIVKERKEIEYEEVREREWERGMDRERSR